MNEHDRFWSKVSMAGAPEVPACWLWTDRSRQQGYGYFRHGSVKDGSRRKTLAHVYAWTEENGPVPEGMRLDHRCHNEDPACPGGECVHRLCVRPDHLDAKPQAANVRASRHTQPSKHAAKTHCPAGHPYAGDNLIVRDRGNGKTSRECRTCVRNRLNARRR